MCYAGDRLSKVVLMVMVILLHQYLILIICDVKNEIMRNSVPKGANTSFENGFIDLLNVYNMYTYSPNLGPHNPMGSKEKSRSSKRSQNQVALDI